MGQPVWLISFKSGQRPHLDERHVLNRDALDFIDGRCTRKCAVDRRRKCPRLRCWRTNDERRPGTQNLDRGCHERTRPCTRRLPHSTTRSSVPKRATRDTAVFTSSSLSARCIPSTIPVQLKSTRFFHDTGKVAFHNVVHTSADCQHHGATTHLASSRGCKRPPDLD